MPRRPTQLCIYCSERPANGKEHWIPRGLGAFRGYVPLLDRVCSECNVGLSVLDTEFLRTGPEAVFRHRLGIRGRGSHDFVNPYYPRWTP